MTDRGSEAHQLLVLTGADVDAVVALHRRAFPDSVLTALGPEVLRRYYRWQIDGPHEVDAVGISVGGELVGTLIGGSFHGSMVGFVKGQPVFLVCQLLRRPRLLVDRRGWAAARTGLRLAVRPGSRTKVEWPERVPDGSFGVLVVAVDPDARREGIGALLLAEAERCARRRGMWRVHLTLDPTNWGATEFYRSQGWDRLGVAGDTPRSWLVGKELDQPS